jgi:hypothetical protein
MSTSTSISSKFSLDLSHPKAIGGKLMYGQALNIYNRVSPNGCRLSDIGGAYIPFVSAHFTVIDATATVITNQTEPGKPLIEKFPLNAQSHIVNVNALNSMTTHDLFRLIDTKEKHEPYNLPTEPDGEVIAHDRDLNNAYTEALMKLDFDLNQQLKVPTGSFGHVEINKVSCKMFVHYLSVFSVEESGKKALISTINGQVVTIPSNHKQSEALDTLEIIGSFVKGGFHGIVAGSIFGVVVLGGLCVLKFLAEI